MPLPTINFDQSLPSGYSPNTDPGQLQAATVRFFTGADQNSITAVSRVFGDLMTRIIQDEDSINAMVAELNANPLSSSFDSTNYVLIDGTHPFTAPQPGIDPSAAAHLATKNYVDTNLAAQGVLITDNANAISSLAAIVPAVRSSPWVSVPWNAGVPTSVSLPLTPSLTSIDNVFSISVIQKLNIGTTGSPIWVYRTFMHGTSGDGIRSDDFWLSSTSNVQLLLPMSSSFATSSNYNNPPAPYSSGPPVAIAFFYRAIVTELV